MGDWQEHLDKVRKIAGRSSNFRSAKNKGCMPSDADELFPDIRRSSPSWLLGIRHPFPACLYPGKTRLD
jgi:hypothetical protein